MFHHAILCFCRHAEKKKCNHGESFSVSSSHCDRALYRCRHDRYPEVYSVVPTVGQEGGKQKGRVASLDSIVDQVGHVYPQNGKYKPKFATSIVPRLSKMQMLWMLRGVLACVRVLGGFPYTWDSASGFFIRRKPLLVWTMAISLLIFLLASMSVIMFDLKGGKDMPVIKTTTLVVMSKSWNITIVCLTLNAVIAQRTLAKVVQGMFELPGSKKHRFKKLNTIFVMASVIMVFVHMASMITLRTTGIIPYIDTITQVICFAGILPCDTNLFLFPLLFYVMCSYISTALEDGFQFCCVVMRERKKAGSKHDIVLNPKDKTSTAPLANLSARFEVLLSNATDLVYHINDILEGIVKYFSVPVAITLLNETLCLTSMSFLTINDSVSFHATILTILFFIGSFTRTALILAGPERLLAERLKLIRLLRRLKMCTSSAIEKQEMDEAITALQDGPVFRIYGIFTLGPHCFLSVSGRYESHRAGRNGR
ncbi:hypothetical protein E2C01_053241 [Portunus trituberculatus]|uniref:Uncharacterized protein n=1 Tax=Portunus trituberculatus TaxID=210409 RepID=A0A5B7GNZ1_PORTR|nr:hypothetical protein [Portunus trituberculatus]